MKKVSLTLQNAHRNALFGMIGTAGEVDLIDKVFYAMRDPLINAGIDLYYEDDGIWDERTGNFIGLLNGDKDYFISLHFDGSTNKDYNGGFIDNSPYDLVANDSWKFAQTVADHYFSSMGIAFRPEHRTNNSTYFYAFNVTGQNTKQFLIELGTLTNPSDRTKLQDHQKIAKLLVEGILAYLKENDPIYKDYIKNLEQQSYDGVMEQLRKELSTLKQQVIDTQKDTESKLAIKELECQQLRELLKKIKQSLLEVASKING
jgi:hypothetical protein